MARAMIYELGDDGAHPLGIVTATGAGVVQVGPTNDVIAKIIRYLLVYDTKLGRPLNPRTDGERWVDALPANLRGVYLWAESLP